MNRIQVSAIMLLSFGVLLTACSSELRDASDLPSQPVLFGAHGKGYAIMSSDNFHATDIRNRLQWDILGCRTCHGYDYNGGISQLSCNSSGCHLAADGGPEACYLCHGDSQTKKIYPQWYNAHAVHLEGGPRSAVTIACTDCHNLPTNFEDPAHIDKETPGRAEVYFNNAIASIKTIGTEGEPTYDATTGSCSNTYCHGNFTNGNNATVVWKGQDQGKCGSCHGDPDTGNPLPRSPHPQVANCVQCHPGAIDASNTNPDPLLHVNGVLNVFGQERTNW